MCLAPKTGPSDADSLGLLGSSADDVPGLNPSSLGDPGEVTLFVRASVSLSVKSG